jgi:glycosyltransferase involved in cell wall biosynthesis
MSKPKVLLIIDRIMIGGAEQVFVDILKLINHRVEAKVLLISSSEPNQILRIQGIAPYYELNRKYKFSIRAIIQTNMLMCSADILHVHLRPTLRYVNFVRFLTFNRTKLVYHDHHHIGQLSFIQEMLMYKIIKVDYYIAVNRDVLKWARNKWNFTTGSAYLLNLPKIKNETPFEGNTSVNLEGIQQLAFVCVGNIKKSKNQLFAASFALKVVQSILFYGNNQDKTYFDLVSNIEGVTVVSGEDNPVQHFGMFKFGLCSSFAESGPLVILEYFVSGLPFLSYRTGGIADVLYQYVPEYFMDTFEMQDWIERYEALNSNYKRIPQELIDRVIEKEFNQDVYAKSLLEIYNKCLKNASL